MILIRQMWLNFGLQKTAIEPSVGSPGVMVTLLSGLWGCNVKRVFAVALLFRKSRITNTQKAFGRMINVGKTSNTLPCWNVRKFSINYFMIAISGPLLASAWMVWFVSSIYDLLSDDRDSYNRWISIWRRSSHLIPIGGTLVQDLLGPIPSFLDPWRSFWS